MPHDLPKAYDPTAIEDHWAEYWVRENLFAQPMPAPVADSASSEAGQRLSGKPDRQSAPFTILLPPPNVTGNLHMGHMFEHTESDILIRWRRMCGGRVLWIPGTDHAGIATQMLVERQVVSEGSSRQQLGREAFVERVWEWRRHYGGAIQSQMKRLGASVDWQREYFTMDSKLSVAVREAFVRLHEQGLIYRGAYIVNWCPRCQTAISDLEVVFDEHKGHLWEIRYSVLDDLGQDSGEFITVATTRPETMLGDTAVAIHPEDERYLHLHGKKLRLPLMGREIPIILDEWVSRDFGTGAVKVTPAHDPNDFALGERHHLPSINVMDDTGHINAEGGAYKGLDRYVARKHIVHDLEHQGLLAGVKDHTNNVGHCDRCKTVVEPRLSTQWFVKIQPLADKAIAAVKPGPNGEKAIRFIPEQYEKTYLNWMENIHDWCISRQLWWGHRIPAWHCATCHKITVARVDPISCSHCGSAQITQETDVLDTWFSSGLLPVSVFGWPNITAENRADFDTFYPTSLLVTGFDILFFWVARMIMLGCWFSADVPMPDGSPRPLAESVPFREVYIHALVRDANREKMSKTKGNVVDPIEIVKTYGTDAVRFTLASMASPGTDIAFNVARTEGYRAFANKIWNAARFIFMNVDKAAEVGIAPFGEMIGKLHGLEAASQLSSMLKDIPEDKRPRFEELQRKLGRSTGLFNLPFVQSEAPIEERWIVALLYKTAGEVNDALENYRFDDAANSIYQFFWGGFCDWYLEIAKLRLDFSPGVPVEDQLTRELTAEEVQSLERWPAVASLYNLLFVFEASLRMLSPFMPFITEELWHAVYDGNPPAKSIALARFPRLMQVSDSIPVVIEEMGLLQSIITEIRALRKEIGAEEKAIVPIELRVDAASRPVADRNRDIIERIARISEVRFVDQISDGLPKHSTPRFDVAVVYERTIDIAAERDRLTKDIAKYEKIIASAERQLNNPGFTAKAPANIVEGLKKQLEETRRLLDKTRRDLDNLPNGE
ncbi:MAG TPA: valine--tRNA ligase [Terracidiphilus sp.]|nr:valine--tRNA ligase [Terracidiphilus sp.]